MNVPQSEDQRAYSDPLVQQLLDVAQELRRVCMMDEAAVVTLAAGFIEGQAQRIKTLQARDDYVSGCLT